jgi:hypothetical protein
MRPVSNQTESPHATPSTRNHAWMSRRAARAYRRETFVPGLMGNSPRSNTRRQKTQPDTQLGPPPWKDETSRHLRIPAPGTTQRRGNDGAIRFGHCRLPSPSNSCPPGPNSPGAPRTLAQPAAGAARNQKPLQLFRSSWTILRLIALIAPSNHEKPSPPYGSFHETHDTLGARARLNRGSRNIAYVAFLLIISSSPRAKRSVIIIACTTPYLTTPSLCWACLSFGKGPRLSLFLHIGVISFSSDGNVQRWVFPHPLANLQDRCSEKAGMSILRPLRGWPR